MNGCLDPRCRSRTHNSGRYRRDSGTGNRRGNVARRRERGNKPRAIISMARQLRSSRGHLLPEETRSPLILQQPSSSILPSFPRLRRPPPSPGIGFSATKRAVTAVCRDDHETSRRKGVRQRSDKIADWGMIVRAVPLNREMEECCLGNCASYFLPSLSIINFSRLLSNELLTYYCCILLRDTFSRGTWGPGISVE